MPKTWVRIRERLYEIEEPLISLDDYETICKESGVEKPEYREQIREYLHDLGIALNYKNDRLIFEETVRCNCDKCNVSDNPYFFKLSSLERKIGKGIRFANCDESDIDVDIVGLVTGVYLLKPAAVNEGLASQIVMIFDALNLNISNIRGRGHKVFQGVKDSQIIIQEKIVDEVSREMNEAQTQMMEKFADEIISRIETKALSERGEEELDDVKKGKWEAKLKFSLPFIPLEFSRTIPPDEFVSKVQKYLYGDDLQTNIFGS